MVVMRVVWTQAHPCSTLFSHSIDFFRPAGALATRVLVCQGATVCGGIAAHDRGDDRRVAGIKIGAAGNGVGQEPGARSPASRSLFRCLPFVRGGRWGRVFAGRRTLTCAARVRMAPTSSTSPGPSLRRRGGAESITPRVRNRSLTHGKPGSA